MEKMDQVLNMMGRIDEYVIDPDGTGDANTFTISNPNFNFKSLRGNLVLRYEIMPGTLLVYGLVA